MDENKTNINWYPGHMNKAKKQMENDLKVIDAVVEILDARIPLSSKNPDIDTMAKNKYRVIILNKCDLADPERTAFYKKYYEDKGFFVNTCNSRSSAGVRGSLEIITRSCEEKIKKDRARGIIGRPIRAMVVGIPNCGKSTFINSIAGKACTKTGNKPGVTKGQQWIRLNKQVELLDTPGILWPKFEDQSVGMKIAFIGSINDDILYPEELAYYLIGVLKERYPESLKTRYFEDCDEIPEDNNEIINMIAVSRGALAAGGRPDTVKASKLIIDDFRSSRIGKITLE
ncbi:MAG: ribosome biogenesis GTPase YlqF [Lachnospiraceae bacterium]|nr:ribosome biogenesis GTPase YlqF [Lachnospiraceae bacterium]